MLALLALLTMGVVAPAAAQGPSVALELVATTDFPTYVWHAGDSRLFVVERDGLIRIFVPGQGFLPTPFLDIGEKVARGNERGLYAIAFHPQYATNGYFFVSHADNGTGRGLVARYQVSADPNVADPNSEVEVIALEGQSGVHNGGQIAFGPDGNLWISYGDGSGANDANCQAQKDDDFFGKMVRINVDSLPYTIPPDNPFVGPADPGDLIRDEIWAKGFRNPWRFSFDRGTGDLFVGDVGQDAREEIDWEPAGFAGGRNYGWKVMEGNLCHDEDPIDEDCPATTPSCFDSAYTPPMHEFRHGGSDGLCVAVGGFVYRGSAIAGLQGKYIFGDICSGKIWSLEQTSPGVWENLTQLADKRFTRSFGEDAAGEIYVAAGPEVYKLVPGSGFPQTRLQQGCINAMNRKGSEVVKSRIRSDAKCVRAAGQRKLATLGVPPGDLTLDACLVHDVGGRTQRAVDTVAKKEALLCLDKPLQLPTFGYRPSAVVSAAGKAAANRLTRSLLGADTDGAIVFRDQNAAGADCQADVADRGADMLYNMWRAALRAKKRALAGVVGQPPVETPEELATRVLAEVGADPQNINGRQLAKLATTLGLSCAGQPLDLRFPGDCSARAATAADFRACVSERVRCHFCRSLEAFDGVTADCDAFDDGAANGSCPTEAAIACGATGSGVNWGATEFDCPLLSQYRLFADPMDPRQNGVGGLPFDLTTPLFSDYALKYRILFLPPGTSATYAPELPFTFPIGTIIAKTFSFADDLRNVSLGEDIIETRLLIHRQTGWEGLPYIWQPGMSDAVLTPEGGTTPVSWIDLAGNPRSTDYTIPSMNQCGFCHFGAGDDPIGPKARLLNRPLPGGGANQLDHWTSIGALTGAPPSGSAPRTPVWNDPGDGTLEQRAKGYIDINCHHCHNPDGRANFMELNFLHSQALDETYGICKLANDNPGGLTHVIVPGEPENSIVAYRMRSILDDERMPEIERSVRHDEGVALVESWIASLSGACPP
jgi:uncharacterized repeat protein (TIGR03806 family)